MALKQGIPWHFTQTSKLTIIPRWFCTSRCNILETLNKTTGSPGWHVHTIWYQGNLRSSDLFMHSEQGYFECLFQAKMTVQRLQHSQITLLEWTCICADCMMCEKWCPLLEEYSQISACTKINYEVSALTKMCCEDTMTKLKSYHYS